MNQTLFAPRQRAIRLLSTFALLGLGPALASAQTVKERLDITRESVENQRRVLVSGAIQLTEAQAKDFWPIYDDYEKKRRGLDERSNRLLADFIANVNTLSDERTAAILTEQLDIEETRLKLRRDVLDRLAKVVPARTLGRYYQIENKLDSVIRADLSRQIPLVP